MDPSQFLVDIESYRLLPYHMAVAMALYLPWLEILCGGVLIVKRLHFGAITILSAFMCIFTFAIISAWLRGLNISCGCFGSHSGKGSYPWLVLRDIVILIMLIALVLREYWKKGRVATRVKI